MCDHGSKGPCRDLPLERKTGSNMFAIFLDERFSERF